MALKRNICSPWLQRCHNLSPNCIPSRLNIEASNSGAIRKNTSTFGSSLIELPVTTRLSLSGETVSVENLKEEDLAEVFQLLESAVRRGDNVGVGEYRSVRDFLEEVRFGSTFTIRSPRSGAIDAVVTVGPCLAARTIRPCLASLQVVTSDAFARESVWRDCFEMAVGFARRHSFGFSACVTAVFAHCTDRIVALRKDGFVITASVPRAGKVLHRNGSPPVYMHSHLLYKEIGPADNKRPSFSTFIELSKEFSKAIQNKEEEGHNGKNGSKSTPMPLIPGLPVEQLLSAVSMPVIVRQLRAVSEDIDRYYEFYRMAGDEDDGFSTEEFPTRELFWTLYRNNYNAVVEEKSSGKWVAVIYAGPSLFARCRTNADIVDSGVIIGKEFRNIGIGYQLGHIILDIAGAVGGRILFSDVPVYDIASFALSWKNKCEFSGTLPRAIYSHAYGWTDVVFVYKSLGLASKL